MLDALPRLIDLAGLDEKLVAVEKEAAAIPRQREALREEEAALAAQAERSRAEISEGELRLRTLEGELSDLEALRARLDQQQYEVTSREAYQALLHEMEATREGISARETAILEGMERLEEQRAALAELEAEAARAAERLEEGLAALASREQELARQSEALRAERAERARAIDPPVLDRYERTARHRHPAAVVISGEVCPQCRVGIPPQVSLQLLQAESLITCPTCHRILIHERLLRG